MSILTKQCTILNPTNWYLNIPLDQTHPFLKGFYFYSALGYFFRYIICWSIYVMLSSQMNQKLETLSLRCSQTKVLLFFVTLQLFTFHCRILQNIALQIVYTSRKKWNWIFQSSDWFCWITPHIYEYRCIFFRFCYL